MPTQKFRRVGILMRLMLSVECARRMIRTNPASESTKKKIEEIFPALGRFKPHEFGFGSNTTIDT